MTYPVIMGNKNTAYKRDGIYCDFIILLITYYLLLIAWAFGDLKLEGEHI